MENIIKERIIQCINTVDALLEEAKQYGVKVSEIEKRIINEKEEDVQKDNIAEHFAFTQYSNFIAQDIRKNINSITELYNLSILGSKIEWTPEEQKILDSYNKDYASLFVLEGGKIKSKVNNLLEVMIQEANTIKNESFLTQYINQIKNKKQ